MIVYRGVCVYLPRLMAAASAVARRCCRYRRLRRKKSDNLQYNMLVRWVDGTNESSTKPLMFQVLYLFSQFLARRCWGCRRRLRHKKFVNLQHNTLVLWAIGTNNLSTKHLMFKVHIMFFFHKILQSSLQKHFQFIFLHDCKNENKEF